MPGGGRGAESGQGGKSAGGATGKTSIAVILSTKRGNYDLR